MFISPAAGRSYLKYLGFNDPEIGSRAIGPEMIALITSERVLVTRLSAGSCSAMICGGTSFKPRIECSGKVQLQSLQTFSRTDIMIVKDVYSNL